MYLWTVLIADSNSTTDQTGAATAVAALALDGVTAYAQTATVDYDQTDTRAVVWVPQHTEAQVDDIVATQPAWAAVYDVREGDQLVSAQAAIRCNMYGEC